MKQQPDHSFPESSQDKLKHFFQLGLQHQRHVGAEGRVSPDGHDRFSTRKLRKLARSCVVEEHRLMCRPLEQDGCPHALRAAKPKRRLKWLLGIGALAFMVGVGVRHFWFSQPQGDGPAGPAVSRDSFASPWTSRPVLLVGMGDSVTAGFGARKGYSYFDRLAVNPPDEWSEMQGICLGAVLPRLQTTNLAVSGSTSLGHVAKQLPMLPRADTNTLGIIVLTTGGNDLIHNYGRTEPKEGAMFGANWEQAQPWITNFAARLELMLNTITNAFPSGCHVFLANIYDPTDSTGDARRAGLPPWRDAMRIHAAYNDVIKGVAAQRPNVHLVDLHRPFLGHGLYCTQFWGEHYRRDDPHYWYFVNLEDPNERGYDAIRRLFLNEMAKVREQLK